MVEAESHHKEQGNGCKLTVQHRLILQFFYVDMTKSVRQDAGRSWEEYWLLMLSLEKNALSSSRESESVTATLERERESWNRENCLLSTSSSPELMMGKAVPPFCFQLPDQTAAAAWERSRVYSKPSGGGVGAGVQAWSMAPASSRAGYHST